MNLFELLQVKSDCTDEDLKTAYRKKCKELHPDLNGGDNSKTLLFIEMKKSYEKCLENRKNPPIQIKMNIWTFYTSSSMSNYIQRFGGL